MLQVFSPPPSSMVAAPEENAKSYFFRFRISHRSWEKSMTQILFMHFNGNIYWQTILPLSWEGSLYNQAFHSIFTVFTSSSSVDLSLGSVHARSLYTVVQSILKKLNQANDRKQNFTSCYIHTWSKSQMNCNTNGVIRKKQKMVAHALKCGGVSDILIVTGEKEFWKGASRTPKQI